MKSGILHLVISLGLVGGCQRPLPRPGDPGRLPEGAAGSPSSPSGEAKLTVEVTAIDKAGRSRTVQQGGTMYSGERMAMELYLTRAPAYAYVLLIDKTGKAQQLYPDPGQHMLLQPGTEPRRIPDPPHWIRLDDQTGLENFFIVANSQPMQPEAVDRLMQAQGILTSPDPQKTDAGAADRGVADRGQKPPRPRRPKPASDGESGGVLLKPGAARRGAAVDRGMEVSLRADAPSTIHFPFHHR